MMFLFLKFCGDMGTMMDDLKGDDAGNDVPEVDEAWGII